MTTQPVSANAPSTGRRKRSGCIPGCFITLLVLIVLLIAAWFVAIRPTLHTIASDQLDKAMTSAVNQVPSHAGDQIPSGGLTLPVDETIITNLISVNLAPSNPVKHPVTHITSSGMRLEFQLYGYSCAISALPYADNGQLKVKNVTVDGIIGLVMSSDEITALLNRHLADAQQRLQHPTTGVQLKDHEVDITLG
ncbi:hypothetical protein [Tengunoibacter tsumagoiensis]|uniref:Uncharacterized protein n=1 Tax=Tengunoibacter tsumagoiensis TaxID=2014871 RepID=A0A402A460_9CHLR|nr:hypothetical protein [Tengunoibacter tsumagoiensis]GCE13910.1 hypothetical protein KTT_37690 [Tengunoibacter tsumagoiensis]